MIDLFLFYPYIFILIFGEWSQLEGRNHKPSVIVFKTGKKNLNFRDIKMHNKENKY